MKVIGGFLKIVEGFLKVAERLFRNVLSKRLGTQKFGCGFSQILIGSLKRGLICIKHNVFH